MDTTQTVTTSNIIPIRTEADHASALESIIAELTYSNGRLTASLSAQIEALSVQISTITAATAGLSQEEFDRLFNSFWTLHYRAVLLAERISSANQQPFDLEQFKCLKHPSTLPRQ